ncbi:MAG TPA: non-canonical purine NTP pyrophosphatase [Patescibacteria group bacterium]|jgi:non-canonical purine NTP pyrophosphatase (RdgB/HAM1 family)|nr:non-canonical purine NTP pyrophosphatase [Patescibacteria group bacterium]
MPTILLATGNERKLLEARLACDDFGITVEQVILEIDEIQNHDPIKVTIHKVNEAYNQVLRPVTITDTSWDIPAYHGFPGAYMKDVAEWFNPKDFISIMKAKNDNRISFTESIAFRDKDKVKVFSQEYRGIVADKPRGESGNSLDKVAEFGGYTLAESHDKGETSHDPKDYIWYKFAKWYAKNYQ